MVCRIDPLRMIILGLILLLILPYSAHAHNGAVAIAVPVQGIAIDGDLSDWPGGMEKYAIRSFETRESWVGETDFQGFFRIGYSRAENALYLAVEMRDDSVVLESGWNAQDGCGVSVDAVHAEKEWEFGQYRMQGSEVGVFGKEVDLDQLEVAVQRTADFHRYEWRIDIGKKTGGTVRLRPGMTLGVDVGLADKDGEGLFSWVTWGPNDTNSPVLGDVILVETGRTGALNGRLGWEGEDAGFRNGQVRIQSLKSDDLWVLIATDRNGEFDVDLPSGEYRVQPVWPAGGGKRVIVQTGRPTTVQLTVPPPREEKVAAGRGRGHWQTFSVPDGLVSNTVYAIHQDGKGNLWFGTENGVSRYDGREFTSFTKKDGLAANWINAIGEDDEGNLWFGCSWQDKGISRYDGERFVTLTIEDGLANSNVRVIVRDSAGNLWFGTAGGGVTRYDSRQDVGKRFVTITTEDGLAGNWVLSILEDRKGALWFGTNNGVSRYDGRGFTSFTTEDGLAHNGVSVLLEDEEDNLWFGTWGGLSRYDDRQVVGERVVTFTTEDGLPYPQIRSLLEDREGNLWLGTGAEDDRQKGMLVRYDGEEFVPFTAEDGLAHNVVSAMLEDEEGHLWFGTGNLGLGGGVSRYSGNQFTSFTTRDGLAQDNVSEIMEDRKGDLWISTGKGETRTFARYDGEAFVHYAAAQWTSKGGGIALLEDRQGNLWFGRNRYDGRFFTSFTGTDELPLHPWHWSAATTEDKVGHLWFALFYGGVVRYDGKAFMPFTDIDNLASLGARSLLWDRRNRLWFGTWHGGLFRWDGEGEEAVHFTMEDGLGDDGIHCLFEDRDGRLWIGTWNGGVSWCDPSEKGEEAFHTLTQKDGLAGNWVTSIDQDRHGRLLLGTMGGGVSLYDGLVFQSLDTRDGLASNIVFHVMRDSREDIWFCTEGGLTRYRPVSTPPPVEIVDVVADQRYGPATEVRLPTTQDHLAFLFQGRSFKTRLGQLAYVYRLEGYDDEWRTTREEQVAYLDLPIGKYRFQVKAVDRDLNYSEEPAQVRVTVHLPYAQLGLIVGLGLALFGLIVVSGYALKKRHDLFVEMEEELDTAHDMQMSLMPAESPEIDGFDIAGRCLPFNHVGGDFFQYFPQDGKLSICMADVTGHAMEAAVPVMMFSGVLKTEIRHGAPFDQLFDQLNRTMHDALDNRTYVCFCMGELDITARAFRLANAACPYPFHFHAVTGEVEEMQVDAYPLGVREGTIYTSIETELEPGDRIIFCSDGIAESTNMQEGMFGFERTSETIRQACVEDLSAEALIDRLIDAVQDFAGDMPQGDDMTVVVLKIEA